MQLKLSKTLAVAGTAILGLGAFADAPTVQGEVTGAERQVIERIEVLEQIVVTSDKPRLEVVDDVAIESILEEIEVIEAEEVVVE